jgi:hypothetical protein
MQQAIILVVPSVDAISATDWEAIVGPRDLFGSHAWLRHLDQAVAAHEVLTVWMDDRLTAAAPIWDGPQGTDELFYLPTFFPDVTGPWAKQFIWLGARCSVRNELICINGPARSRALTQLLAGAVDYARAAGKAGIVLPYLSIGAAAELARVHPAAHAVLHCAEATVTVPPHGVHDLMAQVSYHNRKRRRRELHEFTASGHRLTWTELTPDIAAQIAPLIAATRRKHGSDQGVDWMHRVFAAQRRAGLCDQAHVLLCHRNDDLVATAVCYRQGDSLHGRYFGADEAMSRQGYAYFVTTFYAPVDYAARAGLARVFLSTSALEAKVRRGATLCPLAAVVVLVDQDLNRVHVDAQNRRTALDYVLRFQRSATSLSPDWREFCG